MRRRALFWASAWAAATLSVGRARAEPPAPATAADAAAASAPEASAAPSAPPWLDDTSAPCSDERRAPDPRCGDELGGRREAAPGTTAPQALLAIPRYSAKAIFWPVVWAGSELEIHHVGPWLEAWTTTDDRLIGVRPELQYMTGFLPTVGARVFDRRLPLPGSEIVARFRTAGSSTDFGQIMMTAPAWLGLQASATWNRRGDYVFAGIGPTSNAQLYEMGRGLSRYGSDALIADVGWSRRYLGHVAPSLHADVQRRDYGAPRSGTPNPPIEEVYAGSPLACAQLGLPGGCVDPTLVPGFESGLRIAHAGAGLALTAGRAGRDGGGVSLAFDGTYGQGIAGDPTRLVLVRAETVLAAGSIDRVWLLRVRAAAVTPLEGTIVPFDELVSPSGEAGMRGFLEGRFRDLSGFVATAEYRWFVAFNLDASLFVDVGTVAGEWFSGLGSSHLFPSYGIGLRRYEMPGGPYWMAPAADGIQVAYAPGSGWRLLFSLAVF